jgi:hypothetical protein
MKRTRVDISAIPKQAMSRAGIDRAVIRSDGINSRKLNEGKNKELEKRRAKYESENRKIKCDCVVNRSSGKLEKR